MRITYTAASPKAGITEHIDNVAGRILVASGLATEYKYKDFRERLAAEFSSASGAGNVSASVVGVEWGIRESDGSAYSQNVVVKRVGAETTFLSAPPDDAPESIKRRFAELASVNPNAAAEALDKAKRDAAEYNERSKTFKRW